MVSLFKWKNVLVCLIFILSFTFLFPFTAVQANDQSAKKEMIASAAKSKDVGAVPELINILSADPDGYTRAFAAWALGETGDKQALSALEDALNDIDKGVRAEAKKALSKLKA